MPDPQEEFRLFPRVGSWRVCRVMTSCVQGALGPWPPGSPLSSPSLSSCDCFFSTFPEKQVPVHLPLNTQGTHREGTGQSQAPLYVGLGGISSKATSQQGGAEGGRAPGWELEAHSQAGNLGPVTTFPGPSCFLCQGVAVRMEHQV